MATVIAAGSFGFAGIHAAAIALLVKVSFKKAKEAAEE
jgi:hypothetical protein